MKELFGLKDENGKQYVLRVSQDLRNGEKHFDVEESKYQKASDAYFVKAFINSTLYYAGYDPYQSENYRSIFNWYKHTTSGTIIYAQRTGGSLLQDDIGALYYDKNYRRAKSYEIKHHLIDEMVKRGLVAYRKVTLNDKFLSVTITLNQGIDYDLETDTLSVGVIEQTSKFPVYSQGIWAKMASEKRKFPKTKEELKKAIEDCVNRRHISYDAFIDQFE